MKTLFTVITIMILTGILYCQTTIEQRLSIVQNDGVNGGNFNVAVQVKGTSLTAANTLGSATIDVVFDNTKLTYVSASAWAFGSALGYNRSANDLTTYIRLAITGGGVNSDGGGEPAGFDITASYTTWVQLNFTIVNALTSTNLSIASGSNAIGLFQNHSDEPSTGVITDQTLSTPEVITDISLPVELASFTAKSNFNYVELKWQTASEVNNYGFEIERSTPLSSASPFEKGLNSVWEKVGFIKGAGNSNSSRNYSYADKSAIYGNYIYRLKQLDNNGKYKYSDEIKVATGTKPSAYKLSNYPDPFNPLTTIRLELPEAGNINVSVFNVIGENIVTLFKGHFNEGIYQSTFDGKNLTSGVYILALTTDKNISVVKKVMLVK